MAFTTADLASIEAAIIALATGSRKASVTLNGKRIEYSAVQLTELRESRSQVQAMVSSAAGTQRFILVSSGKGY